MLLEIERPDSIDNHSEMNIISMIETIHNKAKTNLHQISLFYSITNIYDFKLSLNTSIDVLISGIPMWQTKQHTIDNIEISDVSGTMPYHTSPVYVFYLSDTQHSFVSQHIRTNDVDSDKLRKFNKDNLKSLI